MHVIRVHNYGAAETMRLDEVADPSPDEGQVVAKVDYAGVNYFDTQLRSGLYRFSPLPLHLGYEGAGTITAIGPGVTGFTVGDKVAWVFAPGSYATQAVIPVTRLVRLPGSVQTRDAAAVLFQGMTAHYLAFGAYRLKPNDTCLIHSAAGGVGTLLIQLAKSIGARVIGVVSSEQKAQIAKRMGADHVLVYQQEDFAAATRRLTDGIGVHVVYDAVGKDTFMQSLDSLKPRGCLVLYGESSGSVPPFDVLQLLTRGSLALTRVGLDHYIATPEEFQERSSAIMNQLASGELKPLIGRIYPLSDAPQAHRELESRATTGKLLLVP